ncbi:hypothetical protein ACWF82_20730 [Nocardia sp. NPDC055053]
MTHLILFQVLNDIASSVAPGEVDPETAAIMTTDVPVSTADVIRAYRQVIDRAHDCGVAVFGATLTPFGGSELNTPAGEVARRHVGSAAVRRSTRSWTSTPCGATPAVPGASKTATIWAITCTATTPATWH